MQIAIISDIHANLPALDAVLADIDGRGGVDATYHLGDLVGYLPWPNEVVERVASRGIAGVAGNYDSTVANDYTHCGCRYENAKQEELSHLSYAWTRAAVSETTKAFLGALPFRMDVRGGGGHASGRTVTLLHGNHALNTVYVYEDRPDDFLRKIGAGVGASAGDVVCMGHTHRPWHREIDEVHYVNAGSVGKPKDGDWRAAYALLGTGADQFSVSFVRVAYDLEAAMRGIRASPLPHEFALQLQSAS